MKTPKLVAETSTKAVAAASVKRTDFIVIFDVKNGNPNGDPDGGNAPRVNPHSGHGLVTDVCIKRKIRNYVATRKQGEAGFEIFIEEGSVLGEKKNEVIASAKKGESPTQLMCRRFYDVRTHGALLSANKDAEKAMPSVKGPVQFGYAESVDPIHAQDHTITRGAAENAREKKENKTMGVHHTVPYGVYVVHGFINPFLAARTGFSVEDRDLLVEALQNLFENDRSAQRGVMAVRAIYAFEHDSPYGTPGATGMEILEHVQVARKEGVDIARDFSDYDLYLPDPKSLPAGVTMQTWKAPLVMRKVKAAA